VQQRPAPGGFGLSHLSKMEVLGSCRCMAVTLLFVLCSGRIPRLSLNQHSLYVRVVEKIPPPPLTGEQYRKMELKYPEGGHCQSVLRLQGGFNVPLYFK